MLRTAGALVAAITLTLCPTQPASACRVLETTFTPHDRLQIVVWLEDAEGKFVETLFITAATGSYGIGNRPGILDFNSEFLWPYGRRESAFPVWAHRHGTVYPRLVFQDENDRDLSHPFNRSSPEGYFCRPLHTGEPTQIASVDSNSCATPTYTDKGKLDLVLTSLYPPRNDLLRTPGVDSADVDMFKALNNLDAVSRATPPGGTPFRLGYRLPTELPDGEYTIWVEVSKEKDPNASYDFPSPQLTAYGDYGYAYRGQPSVVWNVPIPVDAQAHAAVSLDYAGYGDPDGIDGDVRVPDPTITTNTEGSGAGRLLVGTSPEGSFRVRVTAKEGSGGTPPASPATPDARAVSATEAEMTFVEPDDANVTGYDVIYAIGQELNAGNIDQIGHRVNVDLTRDGPGVTKTVRLTDMRPQTQYWIAVQSHDDCLIRSAPAVAVLSTPAASGGEVSACFVATAAYGSALDAEVTRLRAFRDRYLRTHLLGELLVESYYTFGPGLAAVIRPSDDLRRLARSALDPVVRLIP